MTYTVTFEEDELYNLEAEKALIGALLYDPDVFDKVKSIICADDFYETAYGMIFSFVRLANSIGIKILDDHGNINEAVKCAFNEFKPEFVAELLEGPYTTKNAWLYAYLIAEKSKLRQLVMERGERS